MKKFTLVSLILFTLIVGGIFGMNLAYPPVDTTQTPPQTSVPAESLTTTKIAKHNSKEDCYLIIDDKVYDVSTYIGKHPGGSKSITSRCGEEVTGIFASIHSNFAWDLLNDYYIGTLNSGTSDTSASADVLASIETKLLAEYPGAEIVNVKPKSDFYVAKLIYKDSLYEVHIDASGEILSEELENDEYDWNEWDTDSDDE